MLNSSLGLILAGHYFECDYIVLTKLIIEMWGQDYISKQRSDRAIHASIQTIISYSLAKPNKGRSYSHYPNCIL